HYIGSMPTASSRHPRLSRLQEAAQALKSWVCPRLFCRKSAMPPPSRFNPKNAKPRKRPKPKLKTKKKDPIWVDGVRPRPMFVDYKDIELLKKLINRHGKIVSRRKSGCMAVSQHAVALAIKRARFMALLPYVGE